MNKRLVIVASNFILILFVIIFLTAGLSQVRADTEFVNDRPYLPSNYPRAGKIAPIDSSIVTAITDPVDCNLLTSPVVGYDVSKGQSGLDIASFLNDLVANGYSVGSVDISAPPIPSCVNTLIVQGLSWNSPLNSNYSAAEGAMLETWVANGHSLMLSSDWGHLKDGTQELFQAFGYTVQGSSSVTDTDDYDLSGPNTYWVIYQADNFSGHAIFNGVASIELLLSAWLTPATDAIVITDNDTTATPQNVPVMAALAHGSGCVALSGDSNWVSDVQSGYLKEDNAIAAKQMIDWLNGCFSLMLNKSASSDIVQPGETVTYTMQATNHYSSTLMNVRITDTVPVGTSFVWASNPHTGPDGSGVVTWNLNSFGPNSSATVTMVVQVDNGLNDGAIITNTAYVFSAQGLTDAATVLVTVDAPLPPTAVSGGPYVVDEGSSVLLDGSGSTDPNTLPLSYAWDLDNDGLFDDATGATTVFSAAARDDGVYPIALLVDNGSLTDAHGSVVTVNNVAPQVSLSAANWNPSAGQATSFTGSFIDPGVLDSHTILWDFGDGSGPTAGALNENYTYMTAGQYTVTLTIADDDGGIGQDAGVVTVAPSLPTAVSGGPYVVDEGNSVLLDGSGSAHPVGLPLSYAWDLDNDGLFDDATGVTAAFSAAARDDGAYPVALRVNSNTGSDTDNAAVTVNNVAPQVSLSASNWNQIAGQATSFTGSFIDPGALDTHTILWDFGDGSGSMTGALNENYTYAAAGQYTVTLTIMDDDGGTGQDSGLATVAQAVLPPTAVSGGPYVVSEGSSITLDGGGSSNPGGSSLSYVWDLDNDGQFDDATGTTTAFSAAALDDGTQTIALQVSNGTYTDADSTAVTILNVAPQVSLAATSWQILVGKTVTFTGFFTDPGILDTHLISWDFGDLSGLSNSSLTQSHLFANTGQYTVSLTVEDDDNGEGQVAHQLQVVEPFRQYLSLITNDFCQASSTSADIILTIDTSGSMNDPVTTGGSKLDAAKAAAATFIDLLNFPLDQAGIVSFADSAILEHPLSVNASALHNTLQTLVADGTTRMDLALSQSRHELTGSRHHAGNAPVVILLTDGQPFGVTPEAVRAEADATKAAGIVIYTIGLGSSVNVALMQDIATSPVHYYQAPSATDLNDIYLQIANQIRCD